MTGLTIYVAVALLASGSAFQAACGIGLASLVVPLRAQIESTCTTGPMFLAGTILALTAAWRERSVIEAEGLGFGLAGLAIGTIVGGLLLLMPSGPNLPKRFGILVLLVAGLSVFGPLGRATRSTLPAAGAAAGVMDTLVGSHGPPIALVF